MIEPAEEVARLLRRDVKKTGSTISARRHWAGWRLILARGHAADLVNADVEKLAEPIVEKVLGAEAAREVREASPREKAEAYALMADLWHLSASWRERREPTESDRKRLSDLVIALGVPQDCRSGHHVAQMLGPNGPSPQVTHWMWTDPEEQS